MQDEACEQASKQISDIDLGPFILDTFMLETAVLLDIENRLILRKYFPNSQASERRARQSSTS